MLNFYHYVHPNFCFRPSANSLHDLTCGYDTYTVPAIADIATIAIIPVVTAVAATVAIPAVAAIPVTPAIPVITATRASTLAQYNLPGYFQPKIDNMNRNIYNTISITEVFFINSPQQCTIEQNF